MKKNTQNFYSTFMCDSVINKNVKNRRGGAMVQRPKAINPVETVANS